jgi:hypothetical protein
VHNPDFNYGEFATIRSQAGLNSYKISAKDWVEKTCAIGLSSSAGRYGGTFAHKDIAFEFGMRISPEFKIYLIKKPMSSMSRYSAKRRSNGAMPTPSSTAICATTRPLSSCWF